MSTPSAAPRSATSHQALNKTPRLVIAGASGFVGRQVVPRLAAAGCELLLLGRDPEKLSELFPDQRACGYANWAEQVREFDAVVNFAVVNNDAAAPAAEFERVNVQLALTLAQQAMDIGITRFLQVSSVHALDDGNNSVYAQSKRDAQRALQAMDGLDLTTLYLPPVYGDQWPRSLAVLNSLPRPIADTVFRALAALKPTVHVDQLCDAIINALKQPQAECVVADDIDQNKWYRSISALVDYGFAITVLLLFGWALLLITLWVRSTSAGPGIFAQERLGKNAQPFICYKFRTMQAGTPQAGTHEVSAASITPIGAFLRRTKLDELPQIWNILKGEVRLVGPRPGLPVQTELYNARKSVGVFDMTPGISGWAQIHEVDMSDPKKLATWDARYKGMRSLLFDLRIILATAFGSGQGDRVQAFEGD